jgi:hypothetical protein
VASQFGTGLPLLALLVHLRPEHGVQQEMDFKAQLKTD